MPRTIKLFIDGAWCAGGDGETLPVVNPATDETIAQLSMATAGDIARALDAAERGFGVWRVLSAAQRAGHLKAVARLIRERVDAFSRTLTIEQGKTRSQAKGEVFATAAYFEDLADTALRIYGRIIPAEANGTERRVVYEPIGPTFGVAPWNLPAMMPGRKIANALAAGCSIIVKPAKETPETAYLIAQACVDADIPAGVVNVISGPSGLISETLIASPVIRKISFTGSTEIGKDLARLAGAHMKKVTMELGGHAPVIICDDVDVERTAQMIVGARFSNAGQSCMAPTRLYVQERVYDAFAAAFAHGAKALRVGNGLEEGVEMGPLASARRIPFMESLVEDALGKGAALMTGGQAVSGPGYFFEPTVLKDVPQGARIMSEEPFGPVTPIVPFSDMEAVLEAANSTPYGLAAYVFTRDLERARLASARLEAGLVGVNSMNVAGPSTPFGGVKDSGVGREGAREGLLECMVTKTISLGS